MASVSWLPVPYCGAGDVGCEVFDPMSVVEVVIAKCKGKRSKVLVKDVFDNKVGLSGELVACRLLRCMEEFRLEVSEGAIEVAVEFADRFDQSTSEGVDVAPRLVARSDRVESDRSGQVNEKQLIGFGGAENRFSDSDGLWFEVGCVPGNWWELLSSSSIR